MGMRSVHGKKPGRSKAVGVCMVVLGIVLLLPHTSLASVFADEVELLDIDGTHMVLHWSERDPQVIKIQTSSDGGATWSAVQTIASVPSGFVLMDFDGILKVGVTPRLIASVAVTKGSAPPQAAIIAVLISDDYGQTWGAPKIVLNVPNAGFVGNPVNTTQIGVLDQVTIVTTVAVSGKGYIYFISSDDHGDTWTAQQLGEVPVL